MIQSLAQYWNIINSFLDKYDVQYYTSLLLS